MPINSGAETQHQGDLKSAPLLRARSFQELLDSLPAGAYTCDRDGLITYFNQHSVQLWGRTPKLNDPEDRFCGSFKLFLADGKPIKHEECWMARALKTGQDFNGQEIIVQRPDGSRLTVLAHANPLHDEQGQLLGAVNVLIDISDRKRAEEVQARLASIVESSDDAIISKTVDGIILSWNTGAQRLFGYTPEEAIGSPILLIIPPERIEEENAILSRLRRGERIEHYETVRLTKDGRRIDISLTISPLFDSHGRVIGVSKVAREITARKHAEDTLIALKDELSMQLADLRRLHEMSVRLSTTLDLDAILNETVRTATAIKGTDLGLLFLCDQEEHQLHLRASVGFSDEYLKLIDTVAADFGAVGAAFQERQRVVIEDIEIDPSFKAQRECAPEQEFARFTAHH